MSTKQIFFTLAIGIIVHISAQFLYDKYFAKKAAGEQ